MIPSCVRVTLTNYLILFRYVNSHSGKSNYRRFSGSSKHFTGLNVIF
nr:MAG TPA: hypothetical protein [Caudoviricetes sp.]